MGVTRATRASQNVDHAAREFPSGGEEFRAISVIKLQWPVRQLTPGVGLRRVQVCLVYRLETQIIDVPGLTARRAANVHVWPPPVGVGCRDRRGGCDWRAIDRSAYGTIAFFAFAPIGPDSDGALKVIRRTYLLSPSASLPTHRLNQIAASNLFSGERRVNAWPFHSTSVAPSLSSLRTIASMDAQSKSR